MSQNQYILFYSNECKFSKEILLILSRDKDLDQKFVKVNVMQRGANIPKYIEKVPSAIIPYQGKAQLFVGKNIFKWLEDHSRPMQRGGGQQQQQMQRGVQQQQQPMQNEGIQDYDPVGMTGYSDSFSFINNANPMKKAYEFINESFGGGGGGNYDEDVRKGVSTSGNRGTAGNMISNMMNGMMGGRGGDEGGEKMSSREQEKRKQFDNDMEQMMARRNAEIPQAPMRIGGGM